MGDLVYTMLASLDGYVADEHGDFSWAQPDEEVHRFVNGLEGPARTHLYGRRLYEVMTVWEDPDAVASQPSYVREYGELWRAADKVVYSTTLPAVRTRRTRLARLRPGRGPPPQGDSRDTPRDRRPRARRRGAARRARRRTAAVRRAGGRGRWQGLAASPPEAAPRAQRGAPLRLRLRPSPLPDLTRARPGRPAAGRVGVPGTSLDVRSAERR